VHDELVEITLNLLNLFLVNLLNFLLVVPVPNPTVKGRGFEPAVMCRYGVVNGHHGMVVVAVWKHA